MGERRIFGARMHDGVALGGGDGFRRLAGLVVGVGRQHDGAARFGRIRMRPVEIFELAGGGVELALVHERVGVGVHFLGRIGVEDARCPTRTHSRRAPGPLSQWRTMRTAAANFGVLRIPYPIPCRTSPRPSTSRERVSALPYAPVSRTSPEASNGPRRRLLHGRYHNVVDVRPARQRLRVPSA